MSEIAPRWPKGEAVALSGPRVALDPLSLDHEEALRAVVMEGDLWKIPVTVVPHPDRVRQYIESALRARDRGTDLPWVMRVIATGQVVGTRRFQFMNPKHRKLQVGSMWIAKSWQRSFVASETGLITLTYAFEVLRVVRVEYIFDPNNQASRAGLEGVGVKEEGVLRNHLVMPDGRVRDSVICSLIDREWPAAKKFLQQRQNDRIGVLAANAPLPAG